MSKIRHHDSRRKGGSHKRAAMRIAVFLYSIGIQPQFGRASWATAFEDLTARYTSLPNELRHKARIKGRMLIHERDLMTVAKAIHLDPPQPPRKAPNQKQPQGTGRGLPKCCRCKTWAFKSIWATRRAAEVFCVNAKAPWLHAYECPYGNGWHVGHMRKDCAGEAQHAVHDYRSRAKESLVSETSVRNQTTTDAHAKGA
jgi:hypothetical protein